VDELERMSENLSIEGETGTLIYRPMTSNETKMELGRGEKMVNTKMALL